MFSAYEQNINSVESAHALQISNSQLLKNQLNLPMWNKTENKICEKIIVYFHTQDEKANNPYNPHNESCIIQMIQMTLKLHIFRRKLSGFSVVIFQIFPQCKCSKRLKLNAYTYLDPRFLR